jgi:phage terminase large subunit-like protein
VLENDGDKAKPGYSPSMLPAIFEIPAAEYKKKPDIWKDLEAYERVNPSFGVTVDREFYVRMIQQAKDDETQVPGLLRLHLNIVTTNSEIWIPMDKYDACLPGRSEEELSTCSSFGGLDLSSTEDLTAFVLAFGHPDGGYDIKPFFWMPERPGGRPLRAKADKDSAPYQVWVDLGYMTLTPGEVVDHGFIQEQILELCNRYNTVDIGVDPWNSAAVMSWLGNHNVTCVKFGQGPSSITEPGKEMEKRIIDGTLRHNEHPVLRWNMSNAMKRLHPNDTFKLDKEAAKYRIDGVPATIMAIGRCMFAEIKAPSVYETEDVAWGQFATA